MRTVRYVQEAREEFLHEISYFAAVSPGLAAKFDQAVHKAEVFAAEFAEMGMPYKYGTRRVIPGKFKFSIVYLMRQDEIVVIAVAPFQRKQGYWRSRLGSA